MWERDCRFEYHKPYKLKKVGDDFFTDFSFFAHRFFKENLLNRFRGDILSSSHFFTQSVTHSLTQSSFCQTSYHFDLSLPSTFISLLTVQSIPIIHSYEILWYPILWNLILYTGCPKKPPHFGICLKSLATNMLEGWYIFCQKYKNIFIQY